MFPQTPPAHAPAAIGEKKRPGQLSAPAARAQSPQHLHSHKVQAKQRRLHHDEEVADDYQACTAHNDVRVQDRAHLLCTGPVI